MALKKRWVIFKICLRKRGAPKKGGFPQKRERSGGGGPTLEEAVWELTEQIMSVLSNFYL